jgi:D-glycero-alpha-D-manno-heptose-7-phosphate kinase
MILARTPVRISFMGGGSDLPDFYEEYGGAVLSTSINKHFYTFVSERADDRIQIISADLRVMEQVGALDFAGADTELRIPAAVIRRVKPTRGFNMFLASEIPPGTGLGSSASVCVNLLRALWEFERRQVSRYELAEVAFDIARRDLGEPVGKQDEYAAAIGGLNEIRFEREGVRVHRLELDASILEELQGRLHLFFIGSQRSSYDILRDQRAASARRDAVVIAALRQLVSLVDAGVSALRAGDTDGFGRILDEAWEQKKHLAERVSSERIDRIYGLAREHGALGGKITGAGGGGFLLLLSASGRQAELRQAMLQAGLKEMLFRFDYQGSSLLYNDPFLDASDNGGSSWRFVGEVA